MSKIKVHELAKELEKQSKEVIAFLQEKGIEVKAAQSSVEEEAAEMVRKAFGAAKKADVKAEVKPEAKEEAKTEAKSEAKAEPSNEGKKEVQKEAQKEAPKAEGKLAAPVKKKKIIFVSNPHNSNISGQRSQGERRPQQNNRQGNNNYNGRPGQNREVPHKIIKPLTAPSQLETSTSDFKQNSRRMDEARAELRASEKRAATEREQAAQRAAKPENKAENRNDSRNENRSNNRDGRDQRNDRNERNDRNQRFGQNNQGERNNNRRPENGNRFNNQSGKGDFRNNGGDGNRNRGDFNNNRGERSNGGQDSRFKRNEKPGKSFAQDTPPVKDDKRREEEKRRISQEKDKRSKKDFMYEEDEAALKNKNKAGRFIKPEKKVEEPAEEQIKVITIPESLTIKDLADKMKLQPSAIIKKLFLQGQIVTVNSEITFEDAENIAIDYDIICEKEVKVDVIEELLKEDEEKEEDLVSRPPVICVMGHVDHGKTSLLDAIRKTNVTDKEAGGITQHIGAYTVNVGGQSITFLDTPGHEAFTAMRMRGANSTDIAILVVAADDGVMPQTVEAINHAKAAGIEIIVAVNKIDKPGANIDRVKQEMTEYELIPVDWGGSTEFVPVSAKTGEGIGTLLETVLLTAEIMELKANPNRRARGLVIEAELDKGRGPVATVLVQKGTLHVGDFVSAGASHGKVRAMIDDKGRGVKEAKPSTPVEILGLSDVPSAGEVFIAHENDKTAKSYAETYLAQNKEKMLEETKAKMSLDDLFNQIQEGNLKELNLIVKADVQGSVEAVKQSLMKLSNEEVVVKCIHGGVGAINESDVSLAFASSAIIIGFNVRPDAQAKAFAEREGVDIRLYRVIYQAIEDIEAAMKGMLDPVYEEKVIGHAEVRQIFRASAIGNIAGSYVLDGYFQRDCKVRITRLNESTRQEEQIYEGTLASLRRFKDDVKEVKAGYECGLVFEGFDQMQELDIVEAYIMVEVPR
ncbi:MAG: translation initiation factor IF-2 [Lachnospiraceae bacterium]|nr:translation initiation factor IF-2 [Lachnospiraceae bacterium]